jgi:hypothetical protein
MHCFMRRNENQQLQHLAFWWTGNTHSTLLPYTLSTQFPNCQFMLVAATTHVQIE